MISATGERGFTLVELCLVILILGLMVSLTWPNMRDISKRIEERLRADRITIQETGRIKAREK